MNLKKAFIVIVALVLLLALLAVFMQPENLTEKEKIKAFENRIEIMKSINPADSVLLPGDTVGK